MSRVSVLLPARDAAATLPAALRSILRQTFRDLEVVVVDDASRDGTPGVIEALAARDRRVRRVEGPGRGIVSALEAGRAACSGELVARMDADDVAHPLRLEEQVARLAADRALAGVGCAVGLFPAARVAGGMRLHVAWLSSLTDPGRILRERFVESPLVHPAVTLRARALADAGGWVERGWPEDYDLFLTLLGRGERLANLPAVRLWWREGEARLTRTDPRYAKERHLALKAHHLARGPLAGTRTCAIWGAGKTGRALARALEAHGVRVAYFVDVDAAKVGRTRRAAAVVAPDELPPRGGPLLLTAVAARGARAEIEAHLRAAGWEPGGDYLHCA